MSAKLAHMPSYLINWDVTKKTLKPIIEAAGLNFQIVMMQTGKSVEAIYKNLLINAAQLNILKNALDINNKIISIQGLHDLPKDMEHRFALLVNSDLVRGGGQFSIARCLASVTLMAPLPLEDKVKALFLILDLDGDGYINAKEMHDGIRDFFLGVINIMEQLLLPGELQKAGINANPNDVKKAIEELKIVYDEDKINFINNKCMKEADTDKDGKLSFTEWIGWFPKGAPDAFGSAKILFEQ